MNHTADGVTRRFHMCIDIAGVLRWPDKTLCKLFKEEDGTKRAGSYVRDFLKMELLKGRKVLPMCDPKDCPGFDYVSGCPGHEEPKESGGV